MSEYFPLIVSHTHPETHGVTSLTFHMTALLRQQFSWRAGQSILIKAQCNGEALIRAFSISSAESDSNLRITVKQVRFGGMSDYLVNHVQPGVALLCSLPFGEFTLPPLVKQPYPLFMVGGGSGVFPLFSLALSHLQRHPGNSVVFIDQQRNTRSAPFRDRLAGLRRRFPERFVHQTLLSRPEPEDPEAAERLEIEGVKQRIRRYGLPQLAYICGPSAFENMVLLALDECGFSRDRCFTEQYSVQPQGTALVADTDVAIEGKGPDRVAKVSGQQTLLQGLSNAGVCLPYACLQGTCNVCSCQLVEGEVLLPGNGTVSALCPNAGVLNGVSGYAASGHQAQAAPGPVTVLTCQAKPVSRRVKLRFLPTVP